MITDKFKVSWRHFNNVGKLQVGTVVRHINTGKVGVVQECKPKNGYILSWVGSVEFEDLDRRYLEVLHPLKKKRSKRSETHCRIETLEGVEVSTGIAILNPKDKNYHRRIGMKTSFEDALTTLPNREDREGLWEAFKGLSPKCINC